MNTASEHSSKPLSRFEQDLEKANKNNENNENNKTSTHRESDRTSENSFLDFIISYIFPILGVLMIVMGVGYFFYTGFWNSVSEMGRIGFGAFLGSVLILVGYSFSEKLKNIADSIVGGGVLVLYITLIYGSRFDIFSLGSALFSESFSLIVSILFSAAVAFYSMQRNSKTILILGMIGAYCTPFFIGETGSFEYETSFLSFLLYFLAISVSLFFASFRMNLLSLLSVNILGLFLGTLTLSGLMNGGFAENPFWSAVISFAIVCVHLAFITLNISKFAKENIISSVHYVFPFLWIATILLQTIESFDMHIFSVFSLGSILMICLSLVYFGIWHVLESRKVYSKNLQAGLYSIAGISATIAFIDLAPYMGNIEGLFLTLLSFIFGFLFIRNTQTVREIAFIGTGIAGFFLICLDSSGIDGEFLSFKFFTLLVCVSLLPFLLFFIAKKESSRLFFVRQFLAYLASFLIVILLIVDIFGEIYIPKTLLFLLIPSAVLAGIAIYKSNIQSSSFAYFSLGFLWLGYIVSFFSFLDSSFRNYQNFFLTESESLIGLFALGISGSLLFWIKKNHTKFYSSFHLLVLITFVTVLVQWGSYEIVGLYNSINGGTISSTDTSYMYLGHSLSAIVSACITAWWACISFVLLFLGLRNPTVFSKEKAVGMVLFFFVLCKVLFFELVNADPNIKIMIFMLIGVGLLFISYFLHSRKKSV